MRSGRGGGESNKGRQRRWVDGGEPVALARMSGQCARWLS
jgi:hypothetical protein